MVDETEFDVSWQISTSLTHSIQAYTSSFRRDLCVDKEADGHQGRRDDHDVLSADSWDLNQAAGQ